MVAELNRNSLENICSWMVVLHGQGLFAQAISLEKFYVYRSIRENHETFSP